MASISHKKNKVLGIIPARYNSTRLPGKLLKEIKGKPIIWWVYKKVELCKRIDKVIVAIDDDRIQSVCTDLDIDFVLTSPEHTNGTDRCAEVAELYDDFDFIVNIQGDEPFIIPEEIDALIAQFTLSDANIATAATKIDTMAELEDKSKVKVVLNSSRHAMYFSRHAIPCIQGVEIEHWLDHYEFLRHIGIYIFNRDVLLQLAKLESTSVQNAESLEQLKWLYNGYKIFVNVGHYQGRGIDTNEDLEWARAQSYLL